MASQKGKKFHLVLPDIDRGDHRDQNALTASDRRGDASGRSSKQYSGQRSRMDRKGISKSTLSNTNRGPDGATSRNPRSSAGSLRS